MYPFFSGLIQPYGLLYLATGLAILSLWRDRRVPRRRLASLTACFALLFVLSLPVTGFVAIGSLEWRHPPSETVPAGAGAIVVLGGYASAPLAGFRREAEPGPDTLYRCRHAAGLYRRSGPRPVLVTGGPFSRDAPGMTIARVMREVLTGLGVRDADVVEEGRSRTTFENAVEAAKLLKARGLTTVVLVTDADHMERAARCFRKQGIDVVPSGCRYRATHLDFGPASLIPTPSAAAAVLEAFHEWVGLAWYGLHGRI